MKAKVACLFTALLLLSAGFTAGGQTLKFDTFGAYEQPLLSSPVQLTQLPDAVTVRIDQPAMQVSITYESIGYTMDYHVKKFTPNRIILQDKSYLQFFPADLDVGIAHYSREDKTWNVFTNVEVNTDTNLAMLELQVDGLIDYDLLE